MQRTQKVWGRLVVMASMLGFLFMGQAANAQTVVVQGNSRVDAEVVRGYFSGNDAKSIADGVREMKASGLFSNVRASRSGDKIVVTVSENAIINRVAFEGNSKVKGDMLLLEVQSKSRGPYDVAIVQADVERIKEVYRRAGRAAASVTYRIVDLPNGRIDVVYTINEGDKTGVKTINFVGNSVYSTGKLIGLMQTTEMNFLSFFKNSDVYDPDRISADLEIIRRYYLKTGYADFRIVNSTAVFDPAQGGYIVTITVDEGPQYRVAGVDVQSHLPDLAGPALMPFVKLSAGDIYNGDAVEKSVEALTKEVSRLGYAFSQVRPRGERNAAERLVTISFVVDEGPRVYIERINIRGNTRTRDYVIRREFEIGEGDAYNRIMMDRAERRLNGLGYFKKVRITNEPGSSADRVIVNVDVDDQPTGNFSISGGYSTSDGFIAELSVSESNFMGRGQYVRAAATIGQKTQGVEFNFTEPYFMDTRIAAGFDLYVKRNDVSRYNMYKTTTAGGTLRAGIPLSDELTLAPRYSLYATHLRVPNDWNRPYDDCTYPIPGRTPVAPIATPFFNCSNNGEASLAIKREQGTRITSLLGYTLAYNTLDNPKMPRSGVYVTFNQDFAGAGGDAHFIRSTGEARIYRELFSDWLDDVVGFAKIQGGNMFATSGKLRVTDQFNLGPALVRGFAPGGIGPRDLSSYTFNNSRGNAIGGSNYFGGTLEAQFPIWGIPRDLGLRGAVFADAGTLWDYRGQKNFTTAADVLNYGAPVINAAGGCVPAYAAPPLYGPGTCLITGVGGSNSDTSKIRSSIGGSLLWNSPMGPIRFDLAKALSKSKWDQTQVFRFSGGTNF